MERCLPNIGDYYRHFKGNVYKILNVTKGHVWVRSLQNFQELLVDEDKRYYRFELIYNDRSAAHKALWS